MLGQLSEWSGDGQIPTLLKSAISAMGIVENPFFCFWYQLFSLPQLYLEPEGNCNTNVTRGRFCGIFMNLHVDHLRLLSAFDVLGTPCAVDVK